MAVEVTVKGLGESITTVVIGEWKKQVGQAVKADDPLVEVESEKATADVYAPAAGVLAKILKQPGDSANVGEVIAEIDPAGAPVATAPAAPAAPGLQIHAPEAASASQAHASPTTGNEGELRVMPAAERELAARGLKASDVPATGPGGRLTKEDVLRFTPSTSSSASTPAPTPAPTAVSTLMAPTTGVIRAATERSEKRTRMSPIRRRIAERLLHAQQAAALLTTFNEVDMSAVMQLRKEHQDAFTQKHGVKLGFMSFFVKAAVDALQAYPLINAEISGDEIVERNYCDIGIAIGGGKGLVVPVLRNAERMTFAEMEIAIGVFAKKAQNSTLLPHELQGGTFTITNGGVYGSMMSTPIVNPPQSGVLGMHAIQDRPVARDGQVVIRPMMYLALTYDHRIVDGREAVSFLKRIKDCIENPLRLLLEV